MYIKFFCCKNLNLINQGSSDNPLRIGAIAKMSKIKAFRKLSRVKSGEISYGLAFQNILKCSSFISSFRSFDS